MISTSTSKIRKAFHPNLLPRRFSPRRARRLIDGFQPAPEGFGPRQEVLSRGLCLFRRFDLRKVPVGDRAGALELRLAQWSPFAIRGTWVSWEGPEAMVWIWDAETPQAPANGKVIPETVLHPPPEDGGLRLTACLDGLEAQVWDESGLLRASHWWAQAPSDESWRRFLRSSGRPADEPVPDAEELDWLVRPWCRNRHGRPALGQSSQRLLVLGLFAVLVPLLAFEAVELWRWSELRSALTEQVEDLHGRVEPVLEARNSAEEDLETSRKLLGLHPDESQLELMAAVGESLGKAGDPRLLGWNYDPGKLVFTFASENPDPSRYVTAFQKQPIFHDVRAESDRRKNALTIHLQLSGENR